MGKKWDDLTGSGGFTKPGIGERKTAWPSFGGDTTNPTCGTCGGRKRGANTCACDEPDWHVKGEKYDPQAKTRSRNALQQDWHREWLVEAFRVLQPGGVIKAFSATRTWHRLAAAMEEAGFVDIHLEAWTYGSGFPKSLNIGKALDRAAGAEREVVGSVFLTGNAAQTTKEKGGTYAAGTDARGVPAKEVMITAPATDEAKKWDGFGTAIKPAWEPIVVGRKP